ncbi:MAG: DUF554 domain-containing protein [Enterocloster sp.]
MIGTIANTIAILTGSTIGSILKKGIREEYQSCLFTAMGLAAFGIGINAVVSNMPKSQYPVLFIISLALGSLIGTASRLEYRFQHLLDRFSLGYLGTGLSTAILMFCIGTLSILGPIEAAVHGNHTYLFTNATLDFITSMALASTYGIGIAIAAGVLFLWQGSIYMGAGVLSGFLVPELMCEVSVVGGFLIAASGLSILKVKDCHSMNMLPALLVPPLWFVIKGFVGL